MTETNLLQAPQTDKSSQKPEGLPEKFWDAANNTVRVDALIKSYAALENKLSQGPVTLDDPDTRSKILRALGVPETPDDYKVTVKDNLLMPDPELNKRLHAKGFTGEQVQEVYDVAVERMVPMILDIAADFQADREMERLVKEFGGEDQWREISRQLLAYGRKSMPAAALEGLSSSYDGVMALYRMMKGEQPNTLQAAKNASGLREEDLYAMMRDPKYWREKDPSIVAKVTEGFKQMYQSAN